MGCIKPHTQPDLYVTHPVFIKEALETELQLYNHYLWYGSNTYRGRATNLGRVLKNLTEKKTVRQ
jgi:hypothetical protein